MGNIRRWIKAHLPTQRRLIQLYAALLYNAHAKGFLTGSIYTGPLKSLCVPGLNCYSCPGAIGACPLGALQNAIAASGSRAPAYVLGILLLWGLILGRTVCGFLCPMGLIQELLHKIPTPKLLKGRVTRALSRLKYVILAIFVVLVPLWYGVKDLPLPAFCKYLCPAGTLEGAVALLAHPDNGKLFSMLGLLFTRKFLILLAVVGACVFIYRAFCRFLCPLGAIYGLFSRVAVIGVKVDAARCTDCGRCVGRCPMDVRRVGDAECIHCGACVDACPAKAISIRAGKITLRGPDLPDNPVSKENRPKGRIIAWALALLILIGALVSVNRPDAPAPAEELVRVDESIPVGPDAGMRAPDFTVPLYGGGQFTLSEHLGQTVVLNFWATWCGPCVKELPYFDALFRDAGEETALVAIHSDLVTDDVEGYLAQYDYALPFALDETGAVIQAFGGSMMLPQTVVISPRGVITYNAVGSVTPELLRSLLKEAQTE